MLGTRAPAAAAAPRCLRCRQPVRCCWCAAALLPALLRAGPPEAGCAGATACRSLLAAGWATLSQSRWAPGSRWCSGSPPAGDGGTNVTQQTKHCKLAASSQPPAPPSPPTQQPTCHRRCSTARGQSQEGPCACWTWLPDTMSYSGFFCARGCWCCCCCAGPLPAGVLLPAAAAARRRVAGRAGRRGCC